MTGIAIAFLGAGTPDIITWTTPANGTSYIYGNGDAVSIPLSASSSKGLGITYTGFSLPTGLSVSGSNITGTVSASGATFNSVIQAASTSGATANISLTFNIPSISSTNDVGSVNEGSSVVFTLTGTSFGTGTVYYTIEAVSGTVNSSDFSTAFSGSLSMTNNSGSLTVTTTADVTSEGAETFRIRWRLNSTSGTIIGTSNTITINDTSLSPFSLSYVTQTNGYFNQPGAQTTLTHPGTVAAGDLMVLFDGAYNGFSQYKYTAPSGFTLINFRWTAPSGNYWGVACSYRVLPNTTAITLPLVGTYGNTPTNYPSWPMYLAYYFRPNRAITGVSVGSLGVGLNTFGSGSSYPSGSGQSFPLEYSGTTTVSPSGETVPVIAFGHNYFNSTNPPYTITLTSSPAFDLTLTRNTNENGGFQSGYKLYNSSPSNLTMTFGPAGGVEKVMNSFYLRVTG